MPSSLEEVFPVGTQVIVLAPPNYGSLGEVFEIQPDNLVKVKVDVVEDPKVDREALFDEGGDYVTGMCQWVSLGFNAGD